MTEAGEQPIEQTEEVPGSIDFNKKHFLEHSWTLWFDNPTGRQKQTTWGASLRAVYTFNTVEDFWCMYNNIVTPSRLVSGSDFSLFKTGVEPKWEDTHNQYGGKWTFLIPKSPNKSQLDNCWLNVVLAAIGETFDEGEEVCGIVVNIRTKQDRISIWTKTASNESAQMKIGKHMKEVMEVLEVGRIGFTAHDDSQKMDKKAKDRYSV